MAVRRCPPRRLIKGQPDYAAGRMVPQGQKSSFSKKFFFKQAQSFRLNSISLDQGPDFLKKGHALCRLGGLPLKAARLRAPDIGRL